MVRIEPGVLGVLPRVWRMRSTEQGVVLEGSLDDGSTWVSYAKCPEEPGSTIVWELVGPLQD